MRITKALPVLILLAPFAASCLAPIEDTGEAEEPGISYGRDGAQPDDWHLKVQTWSRQHAGPCADACFEVFFHNCEDAHFVCDREDARADDVITCAKHALTCSDAWTAGHEDTAGLSACWRDCEGLR